MERFEDLKAKLAEIEAEAEKFYTKGNKAAGTRLRKGLQEIKKSYPFRICYFVDLIPYYSPNANCLSLS